MNWTLILGLLAGFVVAFVLRRRFIQLRATPVDPDDPLMRGAMVQAQESLPQMRALQVAGEKVAIKFPLKNADDEIEHVWGGVLRVDEAHIDVEILTPLLVGPTPSGDRRVAVEDVEDWQTFLADGSGIRGGFTSQAQLAICQRERWPVPKALSEQASRFLDPLVTETIANP